MITSFTSATRDANIHGTPYAQLQQDIGDALRAQHPEWIQPNGDCPTCDSYQRRLAELLRLTQSSTRRHPTETL